MAEPKLNMENLEPQVELAIIEGLNQGAIEFSSALASELPSGRAAKAIKIIPAKRVGDSIVAEVGIDDQNVLQYLWAYWKGVPNTITINAKRQWMRFYNWPNGDDAYRWKKDGMFHFKSVQHTYPAHDFIERAISKFSSLADTISKKLTIRLK